MRSPNRQPGDSCHWYTRDGKPAYEAGLKEARKYNLLPSPTSIESLLYNHGLNIYQTEELLNAAGLELMTGASEGWKDRVLESMKKKQRSITSRGSRIHAEIADALNGVRQASSPETTKAMEYIDSLNPIEVMVEMVLVSADLGYGGVIDLIVRSQKGTYLIDWKSKSSDKEPKQYPSNRRQLAAYKMLARDNDIHVEVCANVFLYDHNLTVIELQEEAFKQAWEEFELLLQLYDAINKL